MKPFLGIDYGRARIGVAISDELRMLAHPLETIRAGKSAIDRLVEIARDRNIEGAVVGIPKLMSGAAGAAADEARQFAEKLRALLSCKVILWDERLTTVAAQRALHEAGKTTRASRDYVDQVAAQMILQGFLDSQSGAEEPPDLA
jgi:putative Holliday junction resolvase